MTKTVAMRSTRKRKRKASPTEQLAYRVGDLFRPAPLIFLHIGKTGGTAIKWMLRKEIETSARTDLVLSKHRPLKSMLEFHPYGKVAFVVRDPIARTRSGFYSRLRKGAPRHNVEWTPNEREAFTAFQTWNDLGEALSQDDPRALKAMKSIAHLRMDYRFYLGSIGALNKFDQKIVWIGRQESLDQDVEKFRVLLDLSAATALPNDPVAAHRNPNGPDDKFMSPDAEAAFLKYFAEDYRIYDWCLNKRQELGLG